MDYDRRYKVLFVGNSTVGKSSLILRLADGVFHDVKSTIGVDYKRRNVSANGKRILFEMFDPSGQEQFKSITSAFYRAADAVVLMYDVTNRKTFLELPTWLDEISKYTSQPMLKMLIANKCDLEDKRLVETYEGQSFADEYQMKFLEISVQLNNGVDQVFSELGNMLLNTQTVETVPIPVPVLEQALPRGRCC